VTQQVWDCAEARISLGVYVLGAIDPAERALVDAHLATCRDCRDELAGLASLPALLARVNPDELSRISEGEAPSDEQAPPELVGTVLDLAAARRRRSRWRYGTAAAAAVALAAGLYGGLSSIGGNVAPAHTTVAFPAGPGAWQEAKASSPVTGASADVYYATEHWGTALAAAVDGIPEHTTCQMWVVYADGTRAYAMAWTTADDEGLVYYSGSVPTSKKSIAGFDITTAGKTLVSVPT
jgi:hypothetical protein